MLQTPRITTARVLTSTAKGSPSQFCKVFLTTYSPASTLQPLHRSFHSSPNQQIKEAFPEPDSPGIRKTKPAWRHPIYTEEQMQSVAVAHREAKTWSDWTALAAVRVLRWGLDLATGYKHDKHNADVGAGGEGKKKPFAMNERKYMIR